MINGSTRRARRGCYTLKMERRRRDSQSTNAQIPLFKPRGGVRPGAGRPAQGPRASEPHKQRPEHKERNPVHVVLRTVREVGNLRRRHVYRAIRRATITTARREQFRILHVSIQRTHVHMLVEAADRMALARGMQGFEISAAKHINAMIGVAHNMPRRKGCVFPDRYHATVITSPRQARHALAYVLTNWRRHGEDRDAGARGQKLDWYSSAVQFTHWAECEDPMSLRPPGHELLVIREPRTWLMQQGWRRYTPTISCWEVPSATQR